MEMAAAGVIVAGKNSAGKGRRRDEGKERKSRQRSETTARKNEGAREREGD